MELKLKPTIKVAVEMDGASLINLENSNVYASTEGEEIYLYIKNTLDEPGKPGRELKLRFVKINE